MKHGQMAPRSKGKKYASRKTSSGTAHNSGCSIPARSASNHAREERADSIAGRAPALPNFTPLSTVLFLGVSSLRNDMMRVSNARIDGLRHGTVEFLRELLYQKVGIEIRAGDFSPSVYSSVVHRLFAMA
jgi:hypothetical protein